MQMKTKKPLIVIGLVNPTIAFHVQCKSKAGSMSIVRAKPIRSIHRLRSVYTMVQPKVTPYHDNSGCPHGESS